MPSVDLQQVNLLNLDLFFFLVRGGCSYGRRVEFQGRGNSQWKCFIDFSILQKQQLILIYISIGLNMLVLNGQMTFYRKFAKLNKIQFPMASKEPPIIEQSHLMQLVKGRKFKEYASYIKQIEKLNSEAQDSVRNVLENVLVRKVQKSPANMFNALMLYKQLIIGASVDYFTNDDLFPNSIHEEVAKVCTYKPTIQYFANRGGDYFVDLFKIQKTEANKVQIQKVGNSYVLLALELVQAMAKWYPNEYENKDKKSLFKKRYDDLLGKKITFPKEENQLIIKPTDNDNFKANYQRFIARIKEEEQAANQQKVKKEQAKKASAMKKSQIVKKTIEEKKTSNSLNVQPAKPLSSVPLKKVNEDEEELLLIKQQLTSAIISPPPKKEVPIKREQVPSAIVLPKKQPPKEPQTLKEQPKPANNQSFKQAPKPKEQPQPQSNISKKDPSMIMMGEQSIFETNKSAENKKQSNTLNLQNGPNAKDLLQRKERQSLKQTSGWKIEQESMNMESSKASKKEPPRLSVNQEKKEAPKSKLNELNESKVPNKGVIQQSRPPSNKFNSNQLPKPFSFSQQPQSFKKQPKKQVAQQSIKQAKYPQKQQSKLQQHTPKKMRKTQRPEGLSSLQISPQQTNTLNVSLPSEQMKEGEVKRRRSMPKTQKRNNSNTTTYMNFYRGKIQQGDVQPQKTNTSRQFNKTLSYWASNRVKPNPSRELQKSFSLHTLLEQMRLDRKLLPFIIKYYQPLTWSMQSLRQQSLNLYNSGQSNNQFYSSKSIQCRLLKESNNMFTLIIQNLSSESLQVAYCDLRTIKYSNRIKIMSWGNRLDIHPYELCSKGYMDIKFKFHTHDLNFKFLTFHLTINGKVQSIVLPITLLDMCQISQINHAQLNKYSLTGSIICSQPFCLKEKCLPLFLGGFRFPPIELSRSKRELHRIIGECSLKLDSSNDDEWSEGRVEMVVKVLNWQKQMVEVNILHSRNNESEDLGKIMLYLMLFLLKSD